MDKLRFRIYHKSDSQIYESVQLTDDPIMAVLFLTYRLAYMLNFLCWKRVLQSIQHIILFYSNQIDVELLKTRPCFSQTFPPVSKRKNVVFFFEKIEIEDSSDFYYSGHKEIIFWNAFENFKHWGWAFLGWVLFCYHIYVKHR